jgi:hypothetical protein
MTNEQTAIMLKSISTQISKAIEEAEEYLSGADVPRHIEKQYTGKLSALQRIHSNIPESDYKTIETEPICLDPIKDVMEQIKEDIMSLQGIQSVSLTD